MVRSHVSVRKGLGSIPEPDVTYEASYYLKMALALNPKFCSHSLVVLATHEQKLQIPKLSRKTVFFNQARKHAPNKRMFLYSF